jgi:hypothetical protein
VLCEKYAELGNMTKGQNIQVMNNDDGLGSTDFGMSYLSCFPCSQTEFLIQGNVSQVVPGMHSMFAIDCPAGTGCHQHGFQSATGTEESYQRALKTGSLLAQTGLELIIDDNLFKAVKKEWEETIRARSDEV